MMCITSCHQIHTGFLMHNLYVYTNHCDEYDNAIIKQITRQKTNKNTTLKYTPSCQLSAETQPTDHTTRMHCEMVFCTFHMSQFFLPPHLSYLAAPLQRINQRCSGALQRRKNSQRHPGLKRLVHSSNCIQAPNGTLH